jgi:Fe2+ transport system protein FeoA
MSKWIESKHVKPLINLNEGETGKIVKIRGKAVDHYYLCERGITVGKSVAIDNTRTKPEDTSIAVRIGNKIAEIQKKIALDIRVQVPRLMDEDKVPDLQKEYVRVYINK